MTEGSAATVHSAATDTSVVFCAWTTSQAFALMDPTVNSCSECLYNSCLSFYSFIPTAVVANDTSLYMSDSLSLKLEIKFCHDSWKCFLLLLPTALALSCHRWWMTSRCHTRSKASLVTTVVRQDTKPPSASRPTLSWGNRTPSLWVRGCRQRIVIFYISMEFQSRWQRMVEFL